MANIIIPKKQFYLSKPQDAEIDWGNRLSQDLVCAFLFNERTGTICKNLANPELNGVITNASQSSVWDKGYLGGPCLHMDGSDDVVIVPDHKYLSSIASSYPVSFSMALNYDVDQDINGRILCKTDDSTHAWQFVKATSNSRLELQIKPLTPAADPTAPNAFQYIKCHTPEPSPGIWTKYFVTWDTRQSVGDIYTDGKRTGTRASLTNAIGHSSNPTLDIGGRNGSAVSFDGKIAYLFLWRRVFNNAEIIEHQANPFGLIKNRIKRTYFAFNVAGGTNATANPSTAIIEVLVNSPTVTSRRSSAASATLGKITILSNSPTVTTRRSSSVSVSTSLVSVKINTATASTSNNASSTAAPSLAKITIKVNSPTASNSQIIIVSPSLKTIKILVVSPTVSSSRSSSVTPTTKTITILINSPTVTSKASRIVSPSVASISVVINNATASSSGQTTGISITLVLKSAISKYMNHSSRIEKYFNLPSQISKRILGESRIDGE